MKQHISDTLSADEITNALQTQLVGHNIYIYEETDSTNNRAKENNTFPDGSVFIAEAQTHGKGSRGREWISPKNNGIWLSILLKPDILPAEVSQITLIAGLAVYKVCGIDSMIKWPNDIVINGKKVCGILTEMSAVSGKVNYVVCGIGINVNTTDFDEEIKHRATSMNAESGKIYDRNKIIAKLLNLFEQYYIKFLNGGLKSVIDEYRKHCITLGRQVNVLYNSEAVTGKAVDVCDDGTLAVETDSGIINVTSGEVSVRGIYGYI